MRPVWAEISLSTLQSNFRTIADFVEPEATVCAVVSGDAYGHGAIECCRALERVGCTWFAVGSTEEGIALRSNGIAGRILLLTGFWRGEQHAMIEYNLTPAVWHWNQIELLEDAARESSNKTGKSVSIPVHLKVETGMSRVGVCQLR